MSTKQFRIEVGRGLEGDIPDMIAASSANVAITYFKQGKFYFGIDASIDALMSNLRKD